MLAKIWSGQELSELHNRAESGVLYQTALAPDLLAILVAETEQLFQEKPLTSHMHGKVGVAWERYAELYVCPHDSHHLVLHETLQEKIFKLYPFTPYEKKWCAALLKYDALDGMTSHRDYSYNKCMLGTLVLKGSILFGSGSTRETSYEPENLTLAHSGDFIALKAPLEQPFERPFFCMFSPVPSTIVRIWMREQTHCPHTRGAEHEHH